MQFQAWVREERQLNWLLSRLPFFQEDHVDEWKTRRSRIKPVTEVVVSVVVLCVVVFETSRLGIGGFRSAVEPSHASNVSPAMAVKLG